MFALLYIIQSEPLAQRLSACGEIKEISATTNNETIEHRVYQYVDDTVLFLKNVNYIEPCINIIEEFEGSYMSV